MSGRTSARRRSKTQRLLASEEQAESDKPVKKPPTKPKYLQENAGGVAETSCDTPTSSTRSRLSTPASSRSPTPTKHAAGSRLGRRAGSNQNPPPSRSSTRIKKTRLSNGGSGSATPLSRASRSSSVNSTGKSKSSKCSKANNKKASSRVQVQEAAATPTKLKTKLGRGYNPNLVNYKDSEYHYGSDFEDSESEDGGEVHHHLRVDSDDEEVDKTSDMANSESSEVEDSDSDDLKAESDVDLDQLDLVSRSTTPVPFWLRSQENEDEVPELDLPQTSEDLLVRPDLALKASSVYEVLRHYQLLLRLSPFRFEDFCASLSSEEQSNLLSEVHISLLRAIIRAEEKDNTQFGPLDHKDSVNCVLFFVDSMTWPECLKQYLASDVCAYEKALDLLKDNPEYPFANEECRVEVLNVLTDQFLATNAVREDIVNEGAQALEDHCRVCHRLGDMLICENCSGVYHLACLDPPLDDVPEEDWQCYVCQANQVQGVSDCVGDMEKSGGLTRHLPLGCDRKGNKYWFVCRRVFVEKLDGGVAYYSSVPQFEDLMDSLDPDVYEEELCANVAAVRAEIERQMAITEMLTTELKVGPRKSYLELENASIEKTQEEKEAIRFKEEQDRRQAAEELIRQAKEEEDEKRKQEEEVRNKKEEERRKEREERLRKREENRGDAFQLDPGNESNDATEVKEEEDMDTDEKPQVPSPEITSTNNTTTTTHIVTDEESAVKKEEEEIKEEVKIEEEISTTTTTITSTSTAVNEPSTRPVSLLAKDDTIGALRMTRKTMQQINTGTLYFKLGQEGTYKTYINQYTSNPSALSKVQASEERTKRTQLSHKFSLTEAAVFKWMGQLHGTRSQLVNTLRQTMLQLETSLPSMFMHSNWHLLRKPWIGAVTSCNSPREFARALTVLQCCVKPSLTLNVFNESLGHTQLKKITQQMRDDKKKMEKRERKEREEEEEKLRPYMTHVKYTLGLKHQVAKQRGEEYRAHGQYGWLWLSSSRRFTPTDARTQGLRAGPYRLAVKYIDIRDGSNGRSNIVLMEPKAFKYLLTKQEDLERERKEAEEKKVLSENKQGEVEQQDEKKEVVEEEEEPETKASLEKKKLERALKNARLERQVAPPEMFADTVDVSSGISNPTRVLYPMVAKKARVLDDFLARRLQLKTLEERRIDVKEGNSTIKKEGEGDTRTSITSSLADANKEDVKEDDAKEKTAAFIAQSKKAIWAMVARLKETKAVETPKKEVHRPPELVCYSTTCASTKRKCYSVTCQNNTDSEPEVKIDLLADASKLYESLTKEAKLQGLDLTEVKASFASPEDSVSCLQNLVKVLMKTKDEADNYLSMGMSTVVMTTTTNTSTATTTTQETKLVNGQVAATKTSSSSSVATSTTTKTSTTDCDGKIKVEEKKTLLAASERVYSSSDSSGRLYLKRIQSVAESKRQSKVVKYPLAPHFYAKSRKKRNILLLAKHDAKHGARKAGMVGVEGFNYNAKANNQVWPYPCPRPTFRTAWLYRTASLDSLQAVSLQLRIFWASLKWDDMQTKPPTNVDGKFQETTDSAISTTEILRHRHVGRFLERTEYFQRKVTIPLDVPKTSRSEVVTPIRSGLRKRKRAESPQQCEPKVFEDWVPEEKLELWEVRAYKERLEREKNASVTRMRSGTAIREPQRLDPSANDRTRQDLKSRMEDQLRSQAQIKTTVTHPATNMLGGQQTPPPTIIRRVQNPDGTISVVRTVQRSTPTATPSPMQPGTKKVFISKDGKIIGAQVVQNQPKVVTSSGMSIPTVGGVQNPAVTNASSPQQKVQIVRSNDGKIQVRGLLPGQQLVQMPDGKLQIFSQPSSTTTTPNNTTTTVSQDSPGRIVVHPGGVQTTPQAAPTTPQGKGQIVATLLTPGSPIPPGTSVFMSGGKTYCIPKATTTMANQQPTTPTPSLPSTPVPQQQLTAAAASSSSPITPSGQKQMVEVKSLGQNTVTFKGNQMIVSGPDVTQAQLIAKQLSSGAARLATLGGKQVLISTTQVQQHQQQLNVAKTTPTEPNNVLPVKTEIPNNVKLPTEPLPPPALKQEITTKPVQVTAQLIQTAQGPRIILQGIQGANLPREQLLAIQQQVKEQLLKAQAEAKLQNKVPPTKIAIQLPPIQPKIESPVKQEQVVQQQQQATRIVQTASGQRVVVRSGQAPKQVVTVQQQMGDAQQQQQSLLLSKLTSPLKNETATMSDDGKFELTQDYIQKTISDALRTQNLSPEIEQKLLALQQHTTDQGSSVMVTKSRPTPHEKKKAIDPATGEPMDEEWDPTGAIARAIASRNRKKKAQQQEEVVKPIMTPAAAIGVPPNPRQHNVRINKDANIRMASPEDKRRQHVQNKLQSLLFRQKEQLKRDISRKRAVQEKELQVEIQRDIDRIKARHNIMSPPQMAKALPDTSLMVDGFNNVSGGQKRKREMNESGNDFSPNNEMVGGPKKKKQRKASGGHPSANVRKDKVYCICKTKYDPKKFYVGCDVCNNWFHGSCVGITETMAKTMTEYICDECRNARDNQEIYCLCKQPYDETQFYIGCEQCTDWFHGRCVGILQVEADNIDEYLCPRCDPASKLNMPNQKPLTEEDYDLIRKLHKQLLANRYSVPFKEPVDSNDVPNYYKVVKEPMDLQTIDQKLNNGEYEKMCEFVGDVMRIFENCRYFNQPGSQIMKSAENLESFFSQKLALLREKVAGH